MTLLLLLWLQQPAEARIDAYIQAAALAYSVPADDLHGIAEIESKHERDPRRSSAGACGLMGVLGGRYGASSCEAMEAASWLAAFEGARRLAYFRRHCEGEPLCCYSRGWTTTGGCHYARKVRRWRR